ncbi:MAG: 2,3,4,5-tetrahydropyridine-2,6-dicarboxylate N-succinyltransferase, partial [Bdellovibrionales bacterium]
MNRAPEELKPKIEEVWKLSQDKPGVVFDREHKEAIEEVYGMINRGQLRVAKPVNGKWETQIWAKQTILLYFKINQIEVMDSPPHTWIDKIPLKKWTVDMGVRVVPPATVRHGAYVAKGCILMPSYINVGAYVDEGTMVDTW